MSELPSVKCRTCGTRSWNTADVQRGHCESCSAPTRPKWHRPKFKSVAGWVSIILVFALLYAFKGYTRAWTHGEPMEERFEGARIGFTVGVVIWTVFVIGFLIYEHYKDR